MLKNRRRSVFPFPAIAALLLFLSLVWTTGVNPQSVDDSSERLSEDRIRSWLAEYHVPAVGIGRIENGKLKYVRVFGELKKGVSAPHDTIFQVASLTKPIVEILTLKLVSRHEWQLDEPLAKYWIDPDIANDPQHKMLTTRHVLTHQTGFSNWRSMNKSKKLEFNFAPGTGTSYSGEGLEYLRRALEHRFNKTLEQLSAALIFRPYGMKDTRYFWDAKMDERRFAVAHDKEGKPYPVFKNTHANAADLLLTTVKDYGTFAVEVMKGAGLSKPVFNDMVRPQARFAEGKNLWFGLGWMVVPDLSNSEYALLHTGSDEGVNTFVVLLPKSKRGLIVFTNGDNGSEVFKKILVESLEVGTELLERG